MACATGGVPKNSTRIAGHHRRRRAGTGAVAVLQWAAPLDDRSTLPRGDRAWRRTEEARPRREGWDISAY